ncbi:xanthine dehydrogenase family protein molybdopterin-binding subunit [Litoreibacter janthinus]|uniref:Carbon-monoxide dehydrogenase large subunit n=1 Tax=Litoreibacter janthinus TaxID=670154 RepID=A0A1I6HPJ5_9RHOB|nr:xanthine dehydrogenase family protein molybdopterin-binding subunit [Litoreibacter janthinus]SFR56308.1 carbon-monoxide dehydrogenase large subunit [Litoreibacter janthinus]
MTLGNSKFGTAQPVKRREDTRFLTGDGNYLDDTVPAGTLFGYVFRSSVAHAEITELDVTDAEAADGVHLVLTADSFEDAGGVNKMGASIITNRDGTQGAAPVRPILAKGRVRFVGEPIAMVVADSLEQAKDAAELIGFDYNDLPVHMDLSEGGPAIHPEAPDNVAYDWGIGDAEKTDAAFKAAAFTTKVEIGDNRIIANSMEPRGCWAAVEDNRLHVAYSGQGVWGLKGSLASTLGIDKKDVHVTTPDVGGGFGMKAFDYPEYFLVAQAARSLNRPVRWQADRTESMLSDNAGRDLVSTAELAFDKNHKIIGYRVNAVSNMGAYNSTFAQFIQSDLASKVLMGVYDVQAAYFSNQGIYTNTTQVDAYRGAGRPEAIYVLERAIDYAARELGVDALELRRKNFIAADKFPYTSATGELYDVGDFHKVLQRAEEEADMSGFAERKAGSAKAGKLRGLGVCYYIESILGSPDETAHVEFADTGRVNLYVGTQSNGQGHETVYAQMLHEYTGIDPDLIDIIQGDSDLIAKGGGTGGSRSVTTQGTANKAVAEKTIDTFRPFVAEQLGVPEVAFEDGSFRAEGSNTVMTLIEAAEVARTEGRDDLLNISASTTLPGRSYPNGCHVAEVEIDPDTGLTEVVKYTVVDDFGVLMNPMMAEGQVHGGVVQGIGQAISEHVVYDEDGQLLTATFMDYGMPRAADMPMIQFHSEPVPSTANVLGMKGCGEAGTVGALAAVANGALDAMWERGVRRADMPFTPQRVWQMIGDA